MSEFKDNYGYEVDLPFAIDYIEMVEADHAEVNGFHLWLQDIFEWCSLFGLDSGYGSAIR